MVEVVWTISAITDLENIAEYIAKDSIRYAEITVNELFYSTNVLEKYPKFGRTVPEFIDESIRELIKGNYRVIYKIVNNNRIDILTVHSTSRLLTNLDSL